MTEYRDVVKATVLANMQVVMGETGGDGRTGGHGWRNRW